jgi:hypothetical protein
MNDMQLERSRNWVSTFLVLIYVSAFYRLHSFPWQETALAWNMSIIN